MCLSDKFPGSADTAGPGTTLRETVPPLTEDTGGPFRHPALHRDVPLQGWPGRGTYTPVTPTVRTPAKVKRRVLLDLSSKATCSLCWDPILSPHPLFWTPSSQPWARTDQQVYTRQGDSKSCRKSPPSSPKLGSWGKATWGSSGSGPGEGLSVLGNQ